jgi:ketol-acid reductoisomerase
MTEIFLQLSIGFLLAGIIMIYLTWQIYKFFDRKKEMQTLVPVPLNVFQDMVAAINQSRSQNIKAGLNIDPMVNETYEESKALLEKFKNTDIDSILNSLSGPVKDIYTNIIDIIDDGKYNLKDINESIQIGSAVAKISKEYPLIKAELKDLSELERAIILLAIHKYVTESIINK